MRGCVKRRYEFCRRVDLKAGFVREIFSRVCPDVGFVDVVYHTLRHTAVINKQRASMDVLTAHSGQWA
jgi:hypothetical protein